MAGINLFQGNTIAILFQNEVSGVQDRLPNSGMTATYTFDATPVPMPAVTPLSRIHPDHVRVVGVELTDGSGGTRRVGAGIVIGADGRRSAVARQVEATPY